MPETILQKEFTLEEMPNMVKEIIELIDNKKILFYGEMGSGKTTIIKELIKQLGVDETISSPTFSLVNEYMSREKEIIYHFDFYRIEDQEEAYDMGIEDYLDSPSWCFIEWPDKIKDLLPLKYVEIHIDNVNNKTRLIRIKNSENETTT
ncbi:MAG: tRNA (adenosine(37)-N6)-threonylcarbamoyltransferase complex ATPase subunit type 1 TsaE [Flavobacteriaceae bacterium]|nr:tRNA (adenosine(37)-N6)-threonylcarbamoyltransferase complex ATPase subunit type 1 TsaE [Flavobacteriaceae bacterium]